jgi:hypothetical protein
MKDKEEDAMRLVCMADIAQTLHNQTLREELFNLLIKWTEKLCKE